jgi:hypothetical protein
MLTSRRQFLRASCLGAPGVYTLPTAFAWLASTPRPAEGAQPRAGDKHPGTLLHRESAWEEFRSDLLARPVSRAALAHEADYWLSQPAPTVMAKTRPPPSGDWHDYMSLPPYAWPNPKKADGLPWITRDGEVNPEFYHFDSYALETLCTAVPRLAVHAYASGSKAHARRAGQLLRGWFLDAATRMNPNLRFAQLMPGRDGPSSGIIDTTSLVFLLNAVTRLELTDEWTAAHLAGLKTWVSAYLDWLLGPAGKKEVAAKNNHGTWFDAQVVCLAVFCDRPAVARQQIEAHTETRIATQIESDGRQPEELRRTLALTYSTYNLLAFACIARLAPTVGIDLWNFKTANGRSLKLALQWLMPFYTAETPWSHPQIRPFDFTNAALVLQLAAELTGDPAIVAARQKVEQHPWQRLSFSKSSLAARQDPGAAARHSP